MDGKAVFRTMVRYAVESATTAVGEAGLEREKFVSVIEHTGNTSAASVPLALDHAVAKGIVAPGDPVLPMGFGGGLSWASTVAIWG